MSQAPSILVLALLCLCVALADGLTRYRLGRVLGAPTLSLLAAAVLANIGGLPNGASLPPLYAGIFVTIAPLAIFYLLLDSNLRTLREQGLAMLLAFVIAAFGTLLGVVLAARLLNFEAHFDAAGAQLAALFAAHLIGSAGDFDALAARIGFERTHLYALGLQLNALMATISVLFACLLAAVLQALPRFRHGAWIAGAAQQWRAHIEGQRAHEQLTSLGALALLLVLGLTAFGLAEAGAGALAQIGLNLPSVLLIAVLALAVAATGLPARLPGSQALGRFGVCLFMAVLGAHAELSADLLGGHGSLLAAFMLVVLAIHGLWLVVFGSWLRLDPDLLAIASQASLGNASTAMAVAESRQRHDLALPAIIAGSLGNMLGLASGLLVLRLLA